jgi:cyclophilin family peptidyl-prolyl cis-trans isomerase
MAGFFAVIVARSLSAEPAVTQKVFFDIDANGTALGRIIFGLYGEIAPKAVENFVHLALCDRGRSRANFSLCYKGVRFHSIISDVMIQAGDFGWGYGGWSESIWGGKFPDENLDLKHNGPGILTMANGGKDSNGSQFIITLKKTEWLDGKHQIFGRVMSGMAVVEKISSYGSRRGRPTKRVIIADCGTI